MGQEMISSQETQIEIDPYAHRRLVKEDGSFWSKKEVETIIKVFITRQEISTSITFNCPLHEEPTRATLSFDNSQHHCDIVEAYCSACSRVFPASGFEYPSLLSNWLNENALVDGKWKKHINPFDQTISVPSLKFVLDTEGNPLLYERSIHFVYGKPGTFKSWLALSTLKDHDVRFWDFENGFSGIHSRLIALEISKEQSNGFDSPSDKESVLERVREYSNSKPELLCIDGFSGLAAVMEVNPESNNDVMEVFKSVFFPLRSAGVAVLVLDHLPKDSGSEDYPIGAQVKKSQSDVAYLLKSEKEGAALYLSKDRNGLLTDRSEPGAYPRRMGTLSLIPNGELVKVKVSPSFTALIDGDKLSTSDAELRKSMFDFISEHPECSKSEIERNTLGKTARKREALQFLVANGYVAQKSVGTSITHKAVKEMFLDWQPMGS